MPRATRTRNPYTAREIDQLTRWRALATNTRSTTATDAAERAAGWRFAYKVRAKKDEGYTWRELAEPLGMKTRTLTAFMERRRLVDTPHPSREAYQGVSRVTSRATGTFFPCGIHRIGVDPEYPPTHPGGAPRDALCERAKRRARYAAAHNPPTVPPPSEDS